MSTRNTRNQPFCWQEKKINRLIREKFTKMERVKMIVLYETITEIDSDFNGQDIKFYTKTIATYSGLSSKWIPQGLKELEKIGVIEMLEERKRGKIIGRKVLFTPEKVAEMGQKTIVGSSTSGSSTSGSTPTLEDSIVLEDSNLKEDINTSVASSAGNEVNEIIKLFEPINSNFDELFKNNTERKAVEYLVEKNGYENVARLIKALPKIVIRPYAPKITKPSELKRDLAKLKLYVEQERNKSSGKKTGYVKAYQ